MAIFNGYVTNYQRVNIWWISHWENKHSLAVPTLGYQKIQCQSGHVWTPKRKQNRRCEAINLVCRF